MALTTQTRFEREINANEIIQRRNSSPQNTNSIQIGQSYGDSCLVFQTILLFCNVCSCVDDKHRDMKVPYPSVKNKSSLHRRFCKNAHRVYVAKRSIWNISRQKMMNAVILFCFSVKHCAPFFASQSFTKCLHH